MEKVGTVVAWRPKHHKLAEMGYTSHVGTIIYNTTDGFHRVAWGENNPDPEKFNTHDVFHPDELIRLSHYRIVCTCGNQVKTCQCGREIDGVKPVLVVKNGCPPCKHPNPWKT